MTLRIPRDASRLSSITDFATWKRTVERLLSQFDARIASISRADAGMAAVWPTGLVPDGWVEADGSVLVRAEHPDLFDAIGTTFNTGGETGAQFRLPNWSPGVTGGVYALKG